MPEQPRTLARALRAVPTWGEWLWVALCYLALGALFFWPSIWQGAVPLPLANPYLQADPIWAGQARAGAAGANLLLGDVSGFYYPYLSFTIASLRAGQLPLWNPNLFGGMPYFAANQAALLYPINLLCYWLGPQAFWVATALLRLLVAGCGTYALARRLGTGSLGALLAGGVYMFASFNVVWLHFAIHNVAALLPLALWLIARLAARHTRRDTLALAGVVAAQMFGGHPEMSLFFVVVCAAFAAAWLPWRRSRSRETGDERRETDMSHLSSPVSSLVFPWWSSIARRWATVALAFALGLGLAAVQWAPTLDLIRNSATLHERAFAADQGRAPAADFSPLGGVPRASWGNLRHWLLLVAPELWGWPAGAQIRTWLPERTNYNEMASYFGLAALPLALAGALRGRNRRAAWFFGGLMLASLLLLYPLPGIYRIGYLPLLDVAYGFRFGLGVALGGALLAGLGLDHLLSSGARVRWAVALALAALAALNLAIVYDLMSGGRWALGFAPNEAQRAAIAAVYTAGSWRLFLPAAAGLAAALALAAVRGRWSPPRAGALVVAIALAELVGHGFGYNGFTPAAAVYPQTPIIERLAGQSRLPIAHSSAQPIRDLRSQAGNHEPGEGACPATHSAACLDREPRPSDHEPVRVLNLDGTLWANSAMTHDIQVTGGMDDLVPIAQRRFVERGMSGVVRTDDRQVLLDWGRRLLDLMSVRYVASSHPVTDGPAGAELPLELRDGAARLYRNPTALPRAYAASAVVRASERNADDLVFSPGFDPHRAVVLTEAPPAGLPNAQAPVRPVAIVSYTPNRVELAPDLPAPAIVVLADSYDPDWQVTVDDQPARLLRANARFRGVAVPAGAHSVVFTYRPRLVEYGALASAATLLGCLAWVFVGTRREHGRSEELERR